MAILFVEFGKLIKVVVADAIAALYRVQLLATSAEVEALWNVVSSLNAFVSQRQQHT